MNRAVLVFVKWPEPGRVKTRLAAKLGDTAAADVYRKLVARVFARLPRNAELLVFFEPVTRRDDIEQWLRELDRTRTSHFAAQSSGDLGVRLTRAFEHAFSFGHEHVAAVGTDCIDLDAALFEKTWEALKQHEVVLGPAEDGGYYLVALRALQPTLFRGMDWSTDHVLAQTLARAAAADLRVFLLPRRYDVDTYEDWRRAEPRLNS